MYNDGYYNGISEMLEAITIELHSSRFLNKIDRATIEDLDKSIETIAQELLRSKDESI